MSVDAAAGVNDPHVLVVFVRDLITQARFLFGWRPEYNLQKIIDTVWEYQRAANPQGVISRIKLSHNLSKNMSIICHVIYQAYVHSAFVFDIPHS
jgi:hypothetical protein